MKTKLLKLPSGHVVEIRRVKENDFLETSEMLAIGMTNAEPTLQQVVRFVSRVIAAGAVDPPFSYRDEDIRRDDVVHVVDLENADFQALALAILDFSGLTEKAAAVNRITNQN